MTTETAALVRQMREVLETVGLAEINDRLLSRECRDAIIKADQWLRDERDKAIEARKAAQQHEADLQAEVARLEPMRQRAADIERLTAERDALRAELVDAIEWRDAAQEELRKCQQDAISLQTELEALRAQEPVTAEPSDPQIREALLACGYTIKPGCGDLMPYVYDGARAVLALRKR